jgi:hypothetical protein
LSKSQELYLLNQGCFVGLFLLNADLFLDQGTLKDRLGSKAAVIGTPKTPKGGGKNSSSTASA